jgi:hypothetical protein
MFTHCFWNKIGGFQSLKGQALKYIVMMSVGTYVIQRLDLPLNSLLTISDQNETIPIS